MKKKLRPPVKIHGGKYYLSPWVIGHFPKDYESLTYCEPCCGGASVCLNKNPSKTEVISDVDLGLISIWKAIRDEHEEFINKLKKIKYCEKSFDEAVEKKDEEFKDYIERAINEYVLRRMSRGGMKKTFSFSSRPRGGQPGDVNAWQTMLDSIPDIASRIKKMIIVHKSFKDMVKVWDEPDSLIYLDPPYLPITRSKGCDKIYDNEMSVDDHIALLKSVKDAKGKVIISGYYSSLYTKTLENWKMTKKEVPNHSSQKKNKERRYECLWFNYDLT